MMRTHVTFVLGFFFSSCAWACSSAPPTDPPAMPQEGDVTSARHDSKSPAETDSAELPGAPQPSGRTPQPMPVDGTQLSARVGTLASTPTAQFGGDPYCSYRVTLNDVSLDVRFDGAGKVIAASVEAEAVEQTVQPCSNAPLAPSQHLYHFESATKLSNGATRITLSPSKRNMPQASLIVDVDLGAASSFASMSWHRIDASPPIDWKVFASMPVHAP